MNQNDAPWRYKTKGTLSIMKVGDRQLLVWRDGWEMRCCWVDDHLPMREIVGRRVRRGPDWVWGDQDGRGLPGTVNAVSCVDDGWVCVLWDSGREFFYRWGYEGCYDLQLQAEPASPTTAWQRIWRALRTAWDGGRHA